MCHHPCVVRGPTTELHTAAHRCLNTGQGIRSSQWTGLSALLVSLLSAWAALGVVVVLVVVVLVVVVLVVQLDQFWKLVLLKNRNHHRKRPEGSEKEARVSFSSVTPLVC